MVDFWNTVSPVLNVLVEKIAATFDLCVQYVQTIAHILFV